MKRNIALYLKGFVKGLMLLAPFIVVGFLYPQSYEETSKSLVVGPASAMITGIIVKKYKATSVWVFLALVLGPLTFPFLLGSVVLEEDNRKLVTN